MKNVPSKTRNIFVGIFHAIHFKYLHTVGLLMPHTRAGSDTFIFPSANAACPHHKAIHRNCGRSPSFGDNFEREPNLFSKISKGFFVGNNFFLR